MKFFIANWAQISFILIAIGYIIKVILDSRFKKKEIRYNFFLTNRMKSIEKFLSDNANLESSHADASRSYINKLLNANEVDDIIVPLRYKLTDSLSLLQLYTTEDEFQKFFQVYTNSIQMMNIVSRLKRELKLDEIEKGNELSEILSKHKATNKKLLKEIINQIQKDLK